MLSMVLALRLEIIPTDINQFFPQQEDKRLTSKLALDERYLFVQSEQTDFRLNLEEQGLVKQIIQLPQSDAENEAEIFKGLITYPVENQSQVLNFLKGNQILGPPVVGQNLSDEFILQLSKYLTFFIPLILLGLLLMTSARFVINAVLEISLFSLLLLIVIHLLEIEINSAYLLALLFIYIYIFTLLNQLYFNQLPSNAIRISFLVSIATTWLSGLLLKYSGFGLVSDFGAALTIWTTVLAFYLMARLQFIQRNTLVLEWFSFKPVFVHKATAWSFFIVLPSLVIALAWLNPPKIELNPLILSADQQTVIDFESNVAPSQPILLKVTSQNCSIKTLPCAQKYQQFLNDIKHQLPADLIAIFSLDKAYQDFSGETFAEITPAKYAQFKLAVDMLGDDRLLFANNGSETFFIGSISLLKSVNKVIELKETFRQINALSSDFQFNVQGQMALVEKYQTDFLYEVSISLMNILILLALLFILVINRVHAVVALLPIFLSLFIFVLSHLMFDFKLTIVSLISVILFVGIVSDNLIHILLTYRKNKIQCFKTVFKPVILSNLIMIASLGLMAFFMDGILQAFGSELGLLLVSHLLISLLLLPSLFKWYLPIDNTMQEIEEVAAG